jgi:hypothetical protein
MVDDRVPTSSPFRRQFDVRTGTATKTSESRSYGGSSDASGVLDGWEVRKFRSFLADSGDETSLISQ